MTFPGQAKSWIGKARYYTDFPGIPQTRARRPDAVRWPHNEGLRKATTLATRLYFYRGGGHLLRDKQFTHLGNTPSQRIMMHEMALPICAPEHTSTMIFSCR